jgi:hypothetical protein
LAVNMRIATLRHVCALTQHVLSVRCVAARCCHQRAFWFPSTAQWLRFPAPCVLLPSSAFPRRALAANPYKPLCAFLSVPANAHTDLDNTHMHPSTHNHTRTSMSSVPFFFKSSYILLPLCTCTVRSWWFCSIFRWDCTIISLTVFRLLEFGDRGPALRRSAKVAATLSSFSTMLFTLAKLTSVLV